MRVQLLETILDSSPNCIYVKDKQGRYIIANKTIADLYQTTPDEMIGKKDSDFAHQAILKPNEADFFKDIDKKAIETKETQIIPCESFTYDDGTIHYFFTTKTPITYQGKPDCVMGISVDITKLKETEKKVFESESKFQDIFNKSTTGYSLTKPDGTLSEVNEAFASMLGYTVEELAQMNFEDITHPDDMAKSKKCVKDLLSGTQDMYRLEKRYYHKNGGIVWMDLSTTLMKDMDETPLFFITSIQDITEKKDSSEKLKQSEKKFKTLFNSLSDALFIHSLPDEKIIDVNEETLRRYGYTKKEILGLTVNDLSDTSINSTKSKGTQQLYQKLLDGETIQTEWCSKRKNGETFWHLMTLKIVMIDGEKRLLAQAKDIDKMVRSRNKLAESERKYQSYIDNAPNGVFICDEQGRYLEVNNKAVETTGYSKDELLNMSINDTIPGENSELGLHHFQTLLQKGKSVGEAPFVHKDGTVRWWQINAVRLSENRFLGFTQDITEKKKYEGELRKSEEKYRRLYEAQVNGFAVFKSIFNEHGEFVSYEFIDINPAYERITGVKRVEAIGKDIQKVFPGTEQSWIDAYGSVAVSGESKTFQMYHEPTRKHYFCNVFRPWDNNQRFCVAFNDITEMKQAEQQIRESEKKYHTLFDTMAQGVVYQDANGEIISANPAAERILGLTLSQMQGRTSMHPDWKAVDKDKNLLPGDKHPAMVALRTGEEVTDFLQGIFNPEKNDYVWIIINAVPLLKEGSDTPYQVFSTFLDVTERITMEEKNKNLALFPSQNPNPVLRVSNEGKIIYANKAGLHLMQSKNIRVGDYLPDSKLDYVKQIVDMNENTTSTIKYEGRTFLLSLTPIQDEGYINVYGQDITEQEYAFTQLKQSKNETEMILNTAGDGIRIVTKDFKIKTMNNTLAEITQTPISEGIGQYCYDIFKSDDCGTENCAMRKILRTGEGFECEEIRKTREKREIPCMYKATPYQDEHGEIIGIVEDFRDITSLKESQERFRNIFENKGTAMGMFGDDGVITICNSRFEEMSGFSKKEIYGNMKWSDFVVKDDLERMKQYHRQRSEGGNAPSEYECGVINKQGEQKTMIVNIGVMPNSNERIVSLTDITKQKTVENELNKTHEELKEMNQNLEIKVEERTDRIQQLLQQKDEFINQLGHDIKNPLGPLISLLPLLEKNETNPKRKEMIQVMNRNVRYIKNLVTRTIQLAQLKSPSTGLKYEEFDLGKEIRDIVGNHQLHFDEKQITVNNNIPENMWVTADKLKLQEVFNNLLNNAVKYNKQQGNIIIDQLIDDDTLTISIKDAGVGMTSEQLRRVFDEFYKADSSRHDFDSSGLGMAITKRIIEMHGGKIRAKSEGPGKGSTFYFTLPIVHKKMESEKEQ